MPLSLSHFEIKVRDLPTLEAFYVAVLGMVVTDRSETMVFLSGHPDEHHQVVLNGGEMPQPGGATDHIALRVDNLDALRTYHAALSHAGNLSVKTVSHGNSWSVYFNDPENNRLELFADTPWHVRQPAYFEMDLSMSDDEIMTWTEAKVAHLPGTARR